MPAIPSTCAGTVTVPEVTLEDVAQEQGKEVMSNEVRRLVSSGLSNQPRHWNQHPIQKFSRIRSQLCVVDGVLCRKYTPGPLEIVLVVSLSLQPTALKANHDIISSGYQGVEKTLQRLKLTAYWIGMAKDTELYCRSCMVRQRSKRPMLTPVPMTNIPIGHPWQMLAVDVLQVPVSSRGIAIS